RRAVPLVPERGAEAGRRAVTDAGASGAADPLVRLVEVPQARRPAGGAVHERPVFVPDLAPQLGAEPCRRNRARVPRVRGLETRAIERPRRRLGPLPGPAPRHPPPLA